MIEPFYTLRADIRASFDRAAAHYDSAAVLQHEVSERMQARLDYIKHSPTQILDAGSGTGYGAQGLCKRYPDATVLEVDLALGMLHTARARTPSTLWSRWFNPPRAQHICADLEQLPLAADSVDMVWSNLTLQWLNTPDLAFAEFQRVLRPDGLLMFSTLGPDTLGELRHAFAGIDSYTHVNQFIDMHDLGDALVRSGFSAPVMDMEKIVLTYDDVKSVMRDLKTIGAHNMTAGRRRGLLGKHAWNRVLERYETLRRDGQLPLTYEVIYGHAWHTARKKPGILSDGRQVIEFMPHSKTS